MYNSLILSIYAGKATSGAKIKNPKTGQTTGESCKTKTRIPRMSKLFGEDSEDDSIGQGLEKLLTT